MQPQQTAKKSRFQREWFSKVTDGIMAALILILLWLMIALAIRPIERVFGPPGLLVYVLGLLAVSMFAFQQSLVSRHSDTTRAWYGVTGGFLAWSVAVVITYLGVPILPNLAGVVILIMVGLIVALLWRNFLPLGARFFSLTFLLNWVEYVLMNAQEYLARLSPVFALTYRATGYLAGIAVVLALAWILFISRRRLQRISAALAVWFLVSLIIYVFRGSLF